MYRIVPPFFYLPKEIKMVKQASKSSSSHRTIFIGQFKGPIYTMAVCCGAVNMHHVKAAHSFEKATNTSQKPTPATFLVVPKNLCLLSVTFKVP